jgi:nicotinate-nucleotide adenylyltransferase
MRVGIFGGTFDPPHIGHLILAAEALEQLKLDRLLWVLTPNPPHKQGETITPLEQRLQLLNACLEDAPGFELSRAEIDRSPPHYAVDTVRLLKQLYSDAEMVYLMGEDSLFDLPTWHNPQGFVAACDWLGVMGRPGKDADMGILESQIPDITTKVRFIQAPLLEISSTQIRHRIQQDRAYRYYLHPAVYQVIQDTGLYR